MCGHSTRISRVVWTGITVFLASHQVCSAESTAIKRIRGSLEREQRRFDQTAEDARKALLSEFTLRAKQIQCNPMLAAVAKQSLLANIRNQKTAFAKTGSLPTCDEMLWSTARYVEHLDLNSLKLRNLFGLLEQGLADEGQFAESRKVRAKCDAFFNRILPRPKITQHRKFHGSRYFSDRVTDFHLVVERVDTSTFQGTVRQDRGGVVLQVAGTIDGNRITIQQTKVIRGRFRNLNFSGYFINDRMVLWTGGINIMGKPANDFVDLR